MITGRKTIFSFSAYYILCDVGERTDCEQTFHKIEFTLSDILKWVGESAYKLGDDFELIRKDENVCKPVYKAKDVTINYAVHGSWLHLVNQDLLNEYIDLNKMEL